MCVDYVQFAVEPVQFHLNLHVVNTQASHVITPNSIFAEPPEDGRVTPETCTPNKQNKKSVSI
jgi:hypothetical protein